MFILCVIHQSNWTDGRKCEIESWSSPQNYLKFIQVSLRSCFAWYTFRNTQSLKISLNFGASKQNSIPTDTESRNAFKREQAKQSKCKHFECFGFEYLRPIIRYAVWLLIYSLASARAECSHSVWHWFNSVWEQVCIDMSTRRKLLTLAIEGLKDEHSSRWQQYN